MMFPRVISSLLSRNQGFRDGSLPMFFGRVCRIVNYEDDAQ